MLQLSPGVDAPGTVNWDLALCLLLAWIIVYLCVCKGVKSSGKVNKKNEHLGGEGRGSVCCWRDYCVPTCVPEDTMCVLLLL